MDETVRIIRIETGGSEQTVKGLKDEINSLRDALLNTEKGTEEYKQVLEQLIADQQKLAEVMNAGKSQVSAATGSYNALVNQMTALKKVWRETTDEASRKELGNQIKDINKKLKGMDESIGDYRRNVGNYANSVSAAFGSMGGAAKGMVGPINSVKQAFTALSAHPLMAVLTALAALLINGVAKGFKNSEEASNKMKVSFSALQGVADSVYKAFEKVALWIANVTEKTVKLLDWLGLLSPELKKSMEERKKIAEDEIKLDDKQRANIKKNADLEKQVAELRAQAADKTKYTAQERLKFLEEAEQKEQEIAKNELDALQLEYNIAYAKLQINKDNAELKQQEAEAYAKLTAAQTAYAQKVEASKKAISRTRKEMVSDAKNAALAILNLEKDLIQQEYDLAEDGSLEQLDNAKKLRLKELEIQQEGFKDKFKNRKDYERAMKMSIEAYNRDIQKLEREYAKKQANIRVEEYEFELTKGLREGSSEYYQALAKARKKELEEAEKMGKDPGETDKLFEKRIEGIKNQIKLLNVQAAQAAEAEVNIINQIVLNGIRPMSSYYIKAYYQARDYWVNMEKLETESEEEFRLRRQVAHKKMLDSIVDSFSAYLGENNSFWNTVSSLNYNGYQNTMQDLLYAKKQFDEQLCASTVTLQAFVVNDSALITDTLKISYEELFEKIHSEGEEFNKFLVDLVRKGLVPDEILDTYLQSLRGMADTEREILEYRYNNWNDLTTSIVGLTESVADAYEADLKYAVEHNQKSEEVAKKEFETVKALRISAAIVDTIQGAIAAFMGWQDKGQPWGAIIGATQAAATLAAGWAQIRQIQMTKFGSSGSGGGSTMMAQAQVIPVVSDYTPQQMGLVTGQNEVEDLANAITSKPIKAFVVESEVSAAQELAAQRKNESTF